MSAWQHEQGFDGDRPSSNMSSHENDSDSNDDSWSGESAGSERECSDLSSCGKDSNSDSPSSTDSSLDATFKCPSCNKEHAAACGKRLQQPIKCPVCFEEHRLGICLPCKHGICARCFGTLGGEMKVKMPTNQQKVPNNALLVATRNGLVDTCLRILALPSFIAVGAQDEGGYTALHFASYYGLPQVCHEILARGADTALVNVRDSEYGYTALHIAAYGGHLSVCQVLLSEKSLDVHAQDKQGHDALHYAEEEGHREIAMEIRAQSRDDQ
eukprot:gnl/TRDRNA2_/TRDRNA2_78658_c0_seq1.p1 gnl/TRDRNA2_/TRDRNA2_78658_c0~~gnl/TRDRNA2_/TRDRNA2_78658_c0_seq1.p1  ORF type:complete len:270 (+),score=44.02 gnl/TRDRNA2_/TRDRNA2_78658_c0_seq1:28-837(+)